MGRQSGPGAGKSRDTKSNPYSASADMRRKSRRTSRLSIRGADMQEVYAWTVEPRTKSLNALDETRFRTILADPPKTASDIQVRFVERGQRQVVLE